MVTSRGLGIVAALGVLGLLVTALAFALLQGSEPAKAAPGGGEQIKEIPPGLRNAADRGQLAEDFPAPARGPQNRTPARVGDSRVFVGLDDTSVNPFYLKEFTLRAADDTAEIWVASGPRALDGIVGLDFPDEDCRNDGVRNVVTDEDAEYLLDQFSSNIRPIDTEWFGDPNTLTGKNAQLHRLAPGVTNANAYRDPGGRDIVLVDNVRDDNFYDTDNANSLPRIAGFFSTAMEFFFDRNVITIDSYDWLHATRENPPHDPSTDPCENSPARPFLYESVFAHEYQHLIHADFDPDEVNWVNEGMSDLAEILTGYSDPSLHVDTIGFDSHTLAFLGWNSVFNANSNPIPRPSGPENSLTAWEDQGDLEILADYGHAYYFMTYLMSQGYGQSFFLDWSHEPLNGIEGLNAALSAEGTGDTFDSLFNNIQASALSDAFVDGGAAVGGSSTADELQNSAANATIFFSGDAYDTTGAPPWGSDFVPIGEGASLTSVEFNGDEEFVFDAGTDWTVDGDGYLTTPDEEDETFYPNNLDSSIAREVTVPAGSPTLTFEHYYATELGWDFAVVQVSTDGGQTWTSLACDGTTTDHDPGALAHIVAELPGYTGEAGSADAPLSASCDLGAYAGTNVLLAFRLLTDPSVQMDGWHVRNIEIDGTPVGDGTTNGWDNQKFFVPADLSFYVQVIGLSGEVDEFGNVSNAADVVVIRPTVDPDTNEASLSNDDLAALSSSDLVVVVVSGIPASEESTVYSPYSLLVNGDEAADGAAIP